VLEFSAADLPEGSVVVDDVRGIAWYANADPGEEDRWDATGEKGCCVDSTVDWALQHGATVLRHGDGTEGDQWFESMPAEAPEG
jgi:hypothetical protein